MRILLVDDNAELRDALSKMLVSHGHMVTSATCGLHAMRALHNAIDPYDALLTDYQMPNMTGVELAQQVRKLSPRTRIAIMSGDASLADRVPAGVGFLSKGSFGYEEISIALKLCVNLLDNVEVALREIGQVVLKGLPAQSGYIFHAHDVRKILVQLLIDAKEAK